jgi:vacuolar iron transporter family protein
LLSESAKAQLLQFQRNEITEFHIYRCLAAMQRSPENAGILERIAVDEKRHYEEWKGYTGEDVAPDRFRVRLYCWISRILGLTFGTKLMERGEGDAKHAYASLPAEVSQAGTMAREEGEHETALLDMLDEERLSYIGSVVLGLNDALVELTGTLAGLTFALQDARLIALTGSITGVAAALSMAASEYLSVKAEGAGQHPLKAAIYTGITYMTTVFLLILPFLLLANFYLSLACTLATAVLIIASFTFYVSVAKDLPFRKRFAEMAGLSLGVATLSFLVGLGLRHFLGAEV